MSLAVGMGKEHACILREHTGPSPRCATPIQFAPLSRPRALLPSAILTP